MSQDVATGPGWELRRGPWAEVLGDVQAEAMITDPPYTKRNVAGFRSGHKVRHGIKEDVSSGANRRYVIPYAALEEAEAHRLVRWAARSVKYWFVAFNDHIGFSWFEKALEELGWYHFAPVLWTKPNPPPRMAADGPCCAAEHIAVGRPKMRLPKARRGSRKGWYEAKILPGNAKEFRLVGAKPLYLMRALIRDYSEPGDLIVDPFAGSATTILAAVIEGRRAIGAEVDPETFEVARERLEKGFTEAINFVPRDMGTQGGLFDETEG